MQAHKKRKTKTPSGPSGRETFFATCPPSVEPLLHQELRDLGYGRSESQVGGVLFHGTLKDAWKANLSLRTAIRVLWRLRRFRAMDGDELYRGIRKIDWKRFLNVSGSLLVNAQTSESELDHTLFIEQRVKDAIVDGFREEFGSRPSVSKSAPDLYVHVHLYRNRVTVSLDTSGDSLHKRGWRTFQGRAPLSETLAASILLLSGWDRRSPLVDPFCGSGTLLVEAALLGLGIPPGTYRKRFAFETFPEHDGRVYDAFRKASTQKPRRKLILRGVDSQRSTVKGALENLASAQLEDVVHIEHGDAREFDFKRGWNAWVVSNLPYGERVSEKRTLTTLYHSFGDVLRARCAGYHLALLLSDSSTLERHLRIEWDESYPLWNGSIPCLLRCKHLAHA